MRLELLQVRLLGRGKTATAVLLRAPDEGGKGGRPQHAVAKCMEVDGEQSDKSLQQIETEVKLLSKLHHPNVIRCELCARCSPLHPAGRRTPCFRQ